MPKAKFAAARKQQGKTKPKKAGVRPGAQLSSKRRLSRFGKERRKGESGTAAAYITRTRAIKKLQMTIRDFRRLCILKGVYPRDPKKKIAGTSQTYYHWKDIQYLSNEPLLNQFREFKVFMKKVRRAAGRNNLSEARRIAANKPVMNLDHLIKERYPRFPDAIADLDDCLCMVHLFASLPSEGRIQPERTQLCLRLCREWQNLVVHTRTLRKVFVSVKGIYYQATVQGLPVTWVVPHKFSQSMPSDVDYRVMLTFMEFYEVLLQFVLHKLYHMQGLRYPPPLRTEMDQAGAHLSAIDMAAAKAKAKAGDNHGSDDSAADEDDATHAGAGAGAGAGAAGGSIDAAARSKVQSLAAKLRHIGDGSDDSESDGSDDDGAAGGAAGSDSEGDDSEDGEDEDDVMMLEDEEESEEAAARRLEAKRTRALVKLFAGRSFFVSRETPRESLEFVVRCFGGEVGWDGPGSPYGSDDPSITHFVIDRPTVPDMRQGREYVQPQWVYDSVNAAMMLPVNKYAPGVSLPPHLSPFVDDAQVGYIPAYRTELDKLQAAAGLANKVAVDEGTAGDDSDDDEGSSDSEVDEEADRAAAEARFARELNAEATGVSFSKQQQGQEGDSDSDSDSDYSDEGSDSDADMTAAAASGGGAGGGAGAGAGAGSAKGTKRRAEAAPQTKKQSAKQRKKAAAAAAAEEKRKLAEMMLPGKKGKMYKTVVRSKQRKAQEAQVLRTKRKQLESDGESQGKQKSAGKPHARKRSRKQRS